MSRFNPSDPLRVGLEWDATRVVEEPIDLAREIGFRGEPDFTSTMTRLYAHMPSPPAGPLFNSIMLATLYQEGEEMNYTPIRSATANVIGGSTTGALVGGAPNLVSALATAGDTQGIAIDPGEHFTIFASPSFDTPTPRIVDVVFSIGINPPVTGAVSLQVGYTAFAQFIPIGALSVDAALGSHVYDVHTGETFLAAYDYVGTPSDRRRRAWLTEDMNDFAAGTVQFRVLNTGSATVTGTFVTMEVIYGEENRVGVGGIIASSATQYPWVPGWQEITNITDVPTATLGLNVSAGQRYTVTLTRAAPVLIDNQASVSLATELYYQQGLDRNVSTLGPVPDEDFAIPVELQRITSGLVIGETTLRRMPAMIAATATEPIIGLAQPYADIITPPSTTLTQTFVSLSGGNYDRVRFPIRRFGAPGSLEIRIDGTPSATLTNAIFDVLPKDDLGYAIVELSLSPIWSPSPNVMSTLAADVFTGPNRWEIPLLSTTVTGAFFDDLTMGGSAINAQANVMLDAPITMAMPAPAVTGAEVAAGFEPLTPSMGDCPPGGVPGGRFYSIDYANLCWDDVPVVSGSPGVTGQPLITGFCAWEIERRDEIDPVWRRIGLIGVREVMCLSDFEARIGVVSDYRVRMRRQDGVNGDWVTALGFIRAGPSTSDMAPITPGCDALVFTSNEDIASTLVYPYSFEGSPVEEFTFVEAESVSYVRLHMRDFQVALRPLERGGVRFTRTVLLNAVNVPERTLDEGFRELRDLAWANLTYVCVLDTRGGRWFANISVPQGTLRDPSHIYLSNVEIVEVTDRPSIVGIATL